MLDGQRRALRSFRRLNRPETQKMCDLALLMIMLCTIAFIVLRRVKSYPDAPYPYVRFRHGKLRLQVGALLDRCGRNGRRLSGSVGVLRLRRATWTVRM